MLFHISKQSNWVECVVIDFFCFVFGTKRGIRKFCLGTEKQLYIYKRVCVYRYVCVCFESWSKNFQYMVEKSFEIVIFY